MDDDDYPLSDTDDLSTTAAFNEDGRQQTGRQSLLLDAIRQRRGNDLTTEELVRRFNLDYSALHRHEEDLSDNNEDDDDDDDDGITEEMENLSVSAASDAAVAGGRQSRVNSHRQQLSTARPSLRPVAEELEDYTDEGVWQYLDDNNASAPREDLVDMDDVPDPNDGGNPPPGSPASAPDERGEVMDIDEELVDFNDGGNHRDGEEEDGEDRGDGEVEEEEEEEEEEVVVDVPEEYVPHYRQLLSDIVNTPGVVAALLTDPDGSEPDPLVSEALQVLEEGQMNLAALAAEDGDREAQDAASPVLASPQGVALQSDFAPSPISHPLPAAGDGSEQRRMSCEQEDTVDARNTSAMGVEEFEGNDEETRPALMPKVLFHGEEQGEEAEEKQDEEAEEMSDESSNLPTSSTTTTTTLLCCACRNIIIDGVSMVVQADGSSACQSCLDSASVTNLEDSTAANLEDSTAANPEASCHDEDGDEDAMDIPNTTWGWEDASNYPYIHRRRELRSGSFVGSKSYNNSLRGTPIWGSSSAAALNLVVLDLAKSSTVQRNGTIKWSRPLISFSFADWEEGMQSDLDVIPRIEGTEVYLARDDMSGESVRSALEAIAAKLKEKPKDYWKDCNREVLKFAANALIKIASGELDEFPWFGSSAYSFPSEEEFREANKKLLRQLNGKNKHKTTNILRRLCAPLFMFAQSVSHNGHHIAPSYITQCKVGCPRMTCALYVFESWFHGLLLDEDFAETIPLAYQHDPHEMPRVDKAKLMLEYLRSTGVCGTLHTPIWIRIVLNGSDNSQSELNVNAPEDEVQAMEARMNEMLQEGNNMDRVREKLAALVATERGLKQQAKNRLAFIEENGMEVLRLFDRFKKKTKKASATLTEFQEYVDVELPKIPGLEDFTYSDLPTLTEIDDSTWNNEDTKDKKNTQRRNAMAKATLQFLTLMKPPSDEKEPGQCSHANCDRNSRNYTSNFPWDHFKGRREGGKSDEPSILAKLSSDVMLDEMREDGGGGWVDVCGFHHDRGKEGRKFKADISKWVKLVPRPVQKRGDGKNFLEELLSNKCLRYQLTSLYVDHHIYGWNSIYGVNYLSENAGNFDTLRIVTYAYSGLLADDYAIPTASQWDQGLNRKRSFERLFQYIIQDVSGTCAAATAAGTKDAEEKPKEDWDEDDYACRKGDFDLKNLAVLERQGIEGDHTEAASKKAAISNANNLLAKTDEACHAPSHCFFCHKCRTKNQDRSSAKRNYSA